MENYTPKIHEDGRYVEMIIQAEKCPICKKVMIKKVKEYMLDKLFPAYWKMNQEAQAKRAGIVFKSTTKVDDENICEECEKAGKADFLCALCNERKSTDKIQESIGDAPEFLCKDCYDTVPVKIWDDKLNKLQEAHRYDYE